MGYEAWADLAHAGEQFFNPEPWVYFSSTRVSRAQYDPEHEILLVDWVDGGLPYMYHNVYANEWRNMKRVASLGKFINRVLNAKPYAPYTGPIAA